MVKKDSKNIKKKNLKTYTSSSKQASIKTSKVSVKNKLKLNEDIISIKQTGIGKGKELGKVNQHTLATSHFTSSPKSSAINHRDQVNFWLFLSNIYSNTNTHLFSG